MDWFEGLAGFREGAYDETQRGLRVVAGRPRGGGADQGRAVGAPFSDRPVLGVACAMLKTRSVFDPGLTAKTA